MLQGQLAALHRLMPTAELRCLQGEAELPAAEPPQPGDVWADVENTPITASGRRMYITDVMVKKFGPRWADPVPERNGHAHTRRVADLLRATGPQLTWQWTDRARGGRRKARP